MLTKLKDYLRIIKKTLIYYSGIPFPSYIIFDTINMCNLNCPLCPTGTKKDNCTRKAMSFDTFKTVLDKIPSVKRIDLHNWGEPFLNPELFKMIKYAKKKNILTSLHTNFSLKKNDDFFVKIVESGLDNLILSIDGASRETYLCYRFGGDFDLATSNVKKLVDAKTKLNNKNLKIKWKVVVNKYNETELDKAKELAEKLGVEFLTSEMGLGEDLPDIKFDDTLEQRRTKWLPKNKQYWRKSYLDGFNSYGPVCTHLFDYIVVNPEGKVFPCCLVTDEKYIFGDLIKDSFKDVWNNAKYKYSRGLFVYKLFRRPEKTKTVCSICDNFKKR